MFKPWEDLPDGMICIRYNLVFMVASLAENPNERRLIDLNAGTIISPHHTPIKEVIVLGMYGGVINDH